MAKNNDIKPKFEQITKESPFKVPDNYFDSFMVRMTDKISKAEEAKAHKPIFVRFRPRVIAAMAFTSVFFLVFFGIKFTGHQKDKPLSAQEMVEVYEYLALQDLNDGQLMEQIAANTEEQIAIKDTLDKNDVRYNKEIIEYLSKENIDINTIIESL
jgi:hypothetical protein